MGKRAAIKFCELVPCHHGMARPKVADGENGLQIPEGICEYIAYAFATTDKG
jgi:hypothetical protein